MPIMRIGVPIDSSRPERPAGREAAWRDRMEGTESERQAFGNRTQFTEADLIFRMDAEDLGYLSRARGLAAYYRDHGMLPPRYLAEDLPRIEFTNFDLSLIVAGQPLKPHRLRPAA